MTISYKDPVGEWFGKVNQDKMFLKPCVVCKDLGFNCYSGIMTDDDTVTNKYPNGMKIPCARCSHMKRKCEGAEAVDEKESDSDSESSLPPPLPKSAAAKPKKTSKVPEVQVMTPQGYKGKRPLAAAGASGGG